MGATPGSFAPYDIYGDLSTLLNFGPNRVFIYDYQGTFAVSGLMVNDFNVGGNSHFSRPGSGSSNPFQDAANKAIEAGVNLSNIGKGMGGIFGGGGAGFTKPQIKSPWQTVMDWSDSGAFSLTIDMLLLALTPNENIRECVYQLLRCVYPEILGYGTLIVPPLQYSRVPAQGANFASNGTWGCVGIKIGDWFEAPPVFVVESANFAMSKEQTPPTAAFPNEGSPLYANGQLVVTCSHIVGVNHIRDWFKLTDSMIGI